MRKHLRILICDCCPIQCLGIEKALNYLGCFGVLPVHSPRDFRSLVKYSYMRFDLIILNSEFFKTPLEWNSFLSNSGKVSNTLIYNHNKYYFKYSSSRVFFSSPGAPRVQLLNEFLKIIVSISSSLESSRKFQEINEFDNKKILTGVTALLCN